MESYIAAIIQGSMYGATGWPQSCDQRPDSIVLLGCRGWCW